MIDNTNGAPGVRTVWDTGFAAPVEVDYNGICWQFGKPLTPHTCNGGNHYQYTHVRCRRPDGTTYGRTYAVHKLVALAWHGRTEAEVDHIDRNPANNRPDNLRWVSHAENCRRPETRRAISQARLRMGETRHYPDGLWGTSPDGDLVRFASVSEAAAATGVPTKRIYLVLAGKYGYRSAHGWRFEPVEPDFVPPPQDDDELDMSLISAGADVDVFDITMPERPHARRHTA